MDFWHSGALGLTEVQGMSNALFLADVGLKSASVSIVGIELVGAGIVAVSFTGDIQSVQCAIDAIDRDCGQRNVVVRTSVIGRPVVPLRMLTTSVRSTVGPVSQEIQRSATEDKK